MHDTGPYHPERIDRLWAVTARLEQAGLVARCRRGTVSLISEDAITRVHSPEAMGAGPRRGAAGGGHLTPTRLFVRTRSRVQAVAGGERRGRGFAGDDRTALCLVRPWPPRDADPSMGFCLFNTIALAARRALDHHQLSRILIVDWDVHHGNGTQDVFYTNRVQFLSVHRYGRGFYPAPARPRNRTGPGLGFTKTLPPPFGIERSEYMAAFTSRLEDSADHIRPNWSSSARVRRAPARPDRIARVGIGDYECLAPRADMAKVHANGRVELPGRGLNLTALAESVQIHLETLLIATP